MLKIVVVIKYDIRLSNDSIFTQLLLVTCDLLALRVNNI